MKDANTYRVFRLKMQWNQPVGLNLEGLGGDVKRGEEDWG